MKIQTISLAITGAVTLGLFSSALRAGEATVDPKPTAITVTGFLKAAIFGPGGETTGIALQIEDKEIELVMDPNLQKQLFALDGRLARVSGVEKMLNGVETKRKGVDVTSISFFNKLTVLSGVLVKKSLPSAAQEFYLDQTGKPLLRIALSSVARKSADTLNAGDKVIVAGEETKIPVAAAAETIFLAESLKPALITEPVPQP